MNRGRFDLPPSRAKHTGIVLFFNNKKGYGFIRSDSAPTDDGSIFVHQSDIVVQPGDFRTLHKDQKVEFDVEFSNRGRFKAVNVTAPGGGPCPSVPFHSSSRQQAFRKKEDQESEERRRKSDAPNDQEGKKKSVEGSYENRTDQGGEQERQKDHHESKQCHHEQRLKPTAARVVENGGKNMSINLSVGKKKLHSDAKLARMAYGSFFLNGVQYCRRHLMLYCHLCEVNNSMMRDEVDQERLMLGLNPGGDVGINEKAVWWMDYIVNKQLESKLEVEGLIRRYGKDHVKTHPQHWQNFKRKMKATEREINDRFLQQVQESFDQGARQCCYWACKKPNAGKLFRCSGCKIAKYCCKEHQQKDWLWEHKGECTSQVPQFIKDEIEQDRQRNLRGDYRYRDLDGALEDAYKCFS